MRLHAQAPSRVSETVRDGAPRILGHHRSVHRLQKEVIELERFKSLGRRIRLRVYELELIPVRQHELRGRLGAHAYPIETRGSVLGPVRLDGNLESRCVKRANRLVIELQEWLASRTHNERPGAGVRGP